MIRIEEVKLAAASKGKAQREEKRGVHLAFWKPRKRPYSRSVTPLPPALWRRKDLETVIPCLLPEGAHTQGYLFRVILDDQDQELGFVWAGPLPGLRQEQRFLFDAFVIPSCRGRGVGRAALEQALEELRAVGVREVTLEVAGDNAPARALGRILGYEELDKPSGARSVLLRRTF